MNPEGPIGDAFQALDPPSFVTICQIIVSNTEAHYCLQIEHVSEVKGVLSLYASGAGDAAAVLGARYAKREDSVCRTETQQERIHEYVWHVAHDLATIIVVSTLCCDPLSIRS